MSSHCLFVWWESSRWARRGSLACGGRCSHASRKCPSLWFVTVYDLSVDLFDCILLGSAVGLSSSLAGFQPLHLQVFFLPRLSPLLLCLLSFSVVPYRCLRRGLFFVIFSSLPSNWILTSLQICGGFFLPRKSAEPLLWIVLFGYFLTFRVPFFFYDFCLDRCFLFCNSSVSYFFSSLSGNDPCEAVHFQSSGKVGFAPFCQCLIPFMEGSFD